MKEENQAKVAHAIFNAFANYKKEVEGTQTGVAISTKEDVKEKQETKPVVNTKTEEKTSGPKQDPDPKITSKPVTSNVPPSDISYRVQVAASSKPTIDARYHSLQDLEVIKEDGLFKFVVGKFSTREEALSCLTGLKEKGFQGAFITSYKGNQRIKA